jgi:pimeloyl-ACP methyl ester carboxylesterase
MRHLAFASTALAVVVVVQGCDDQIAAVPAPDAAADAPVTTPASTDASAPSDASAGGLAFGGCPGAYSGACAKVDVPLDWSKPDGKKIPLFINKISTTSKPKGQLWLLEGGPGGSGAGMVPVAMQIAAARSDLDIYTLDHRGVGQSARLGCSKEPDEKVFDDVLDGGVDGGVDGGLDAGVIEPAAVWKPCLDEIVAQWGDGLAQFTTTNAARDLAHAIDLLREPDRGVYVLGVSYGTYWAHRYLQIFPNQPTAVILDSILPADGEFFTRFDFHFDAVAQKLAEICKTDATCTSHLGADPWAKLQSIAAKIGTDHCPEAGLTQKNRGMLNQLFLGWDTRPLAFAALHRFDRCNAEDVQALKTLKSRIEAMPRPPSSSTFSQALYFNVAFSELWEKPTPSRDELRARAAAAVFPARTELQSPLEAMWPKYPPDSFVRGYATTSVPVLMINGTLDAQTPIETAEVLKSKLAGPHQTFVSIPNGNHTVLFQSPVKTKGRPCGFTIAMSFLDDPNGTVDTSCLADLAPVTFEPSTQSTQFLGTKSLWTGVFVPDGVMPSFDPLLNLPVRHLFPTLDLRQRL